MTLGLVCSWIYHIRGLQWEHVLGDSENYHGGQLKRFSCGLPSGNLLHSELENHHAINIGKRYLFRLGPFSSSQKLLVHQRVYTIKSH